MRRLAPMLGGDRRRIELAYSLQLSMPGTPSSATAKRSAWATTSTCPNEMRSAPPCSGIAPRAQASLVPSRAKTPARCVRPEPLRVAGSGSWPAGHVLPGLSRLPDHGFLWIATGHRQARRAAWRGLGSMAAASAAANVIGKGLTGRHRPYVDVPVRSRLRRVPRGSSFPFGHAANAAASTRLAGRLAADLPEATIMETDAGDPPNPGSSTASIRTRWWSTARPTTSQTGDVAPRRAAQSGQRSEGR